MSRAGKSPKLVARDVEGVLKAEMDLDVDYKKIGVVVLDPEEAPPADLPPEEFPILEHASRFAFISVNVVSTRAGLRAEVELSRDAGGAFGSSESENPSATALTVVAEATLRAVSEFLDEQTRLCLGGVLKVSMAGDDAILVRVDIVGTRGNKIARGFGHGDRQRSPSGRVRNPRRHQSSDRKIRIQEFDRIQDQVTP